MNKEFKECKIRFTDDYYEFDKESETKLAAPEWKVYFDGNFWGHHGKDHAGKEIRIEKGFDWAGYHWVIPAAYSCSKGIVVDFCMWVDPKAIRDFMNKWGLDWENAAGKEITCEQRMQMALENPLCFSFTPYLRLNEKILQTTHGCAVSFYPGLPEGVVNGPEAERVIDHYGLDRAFGWVISRNVFPWETRRRPDIHSLSLTMKQQPEQVPGGRFKAHAAGDSFMFSHPVSGTTHTLTVQAMEQQTIPQTGFGSDRWKFPTHHMVMSYTVTPEPIEDLSILDCAEGDRPVEIASDNDSFHPAVGCACFSIGVIGGADSPTAIAYGPNLQAKLHAACSSLHFEPVCDDIEWYIVFHVTQFDEASFPLIEKKPKGGKYK